MAVCEVCGKRSFSTFSVDGGHRVCDKCLDEVGLLVKVGPMKMLNPVKAFQEESILNYMYHRKSGTSPMEFGIKHEKTDVSDDVSAVDGMDGHAFEHFCAELLRQNGYSDVSVTPGSGDQGVDILAKKDGIKYAVQCKNYSSPLGNTPVQEISAGKTFYKCHVGVVMTNSTFTPGAIALADATGVALWDRNVLQKLMRGR